MKKLLITAILLSTVCACSKDKNELQPRLAGAPKTPVNAQLQQAIAQQQMAAAPRPQNLNPQNQFVPNQPVGPSGIMDVNPQPQAEVFMNEQVGIGTAPAAIPGNEGIDQVQDVPPVDSLAPAPVAIQQPAPQPMMPLPAFIPTQRAVAPVATDPNAAVVATDKKLPASLRPGYNNPLNNLPAYPMPVAPMPMAPMMQQGFAPAPMAPQYAPMPMQPMGQPMLQPVYAPTQPVPQMQMYTQPVPAR